MTAGHVPNLWHDKGTDADFTFNESGEFVDSTGRAPGPGFSLSDRELVDWLHSFVQQRLTSLGLERRTLPDGSAFIYSTPWAFDSARDLLVLICGDGRIMPGLWSIGVCVYKGLAAGSVLPMIDQARRRNMEIAILNPNSAFWHAGKVAHIRRVFESLIIPAAPARVWIIGHSFGGVVLDVLRRTPAWTIEHVKAIAMTDGFETAIAAAGFQINRWCHEHAINWVCSTADVNSDLPNGPSARHRSAGTRDHPLTTHMAFEYIWQFFDERARVLGESEADYVGEERVPFTLPRCCVA
jgi:hypothetical protein